MKQYTLAFLAGAATAAARAPIERSYLREMADSYIRRGVRGGFHYGEATLYTGMEAVIAATDNQTIIDWYKNQIDELVLNDDGTIKDWEYDFYSLDEYRISNNFMYWHQKTGDEKYRTASDIIHTQLTERHPKTPLGGFWHRDPTYPNQMWLDGIYMADSTYANYLSLYQNDNETAWDELLFQYDHIESRTRNKTSNLLVHGFDESITAVWADPVTGAAPLVWNRAVGWYYWSLTEAIAVVPESHPGHARLVDYFVTLSAGLKATYDGGWWLIMSEPYPGAEGNYLESSAHAMFTYGLLHGIRTGLLTEEEYGSVATESYEELIAKFVTDNDDGTINFIETVEVGSLSSNGTYEYYVGVPTVINDSRAGGAFLVAAAEYEMRA